MREMCIDGIGWMVFASGKLDRCQRGDGGQDRGKNQYFKDESSNRERKRKMKKKDRRKKEAFRSRETGGTRFKAKGLRGNTWRGKKRECL